MNFSSSLPKKTVGSPSYYVPVVLSRIKLQFQMQRKWDITNATLVIQFVIQRNRHFWYFSCSLSVSIKSDINYWLFRCLPTACFDNIFCFTLRSGRHIEESCRLVLIFQDGSYFKSIFIERYQNLQLSLQLLSIKV